MDLIRAKVKVIKIRELFTTMDVYILLIRYKILISLHPIWYYCQFNVDKDSTIDFPLLVMSMVPWNELFDRYPKNLVHSCSW